MEIICPPNSWSKTHSTVMESNSIPAQQVNIHEVNVKKKQKLGKRKTGHFTDLPARIAEITNGKHTSSQEDIDNTGHIKPRIKVSKLYPCLQNTAVYQSQIYMPVMNSYPLRGETH